MNFQGKTVIVGATSGIAIAIGEQIARSGTDLVVVGRNQARLDAVAAHLRVAGGKASVKVAISLKAIEPAWKEIWEAGPVACVIIAQGMLPGEGASPSSEKIQETFEANTIGPILWCQAAAASMMRQETGTIAVLGSVAGDRGRLKNHIYAGAKSAIETYCEGLTLRVGPKVKVCLIKPGMTDTAMTADLKHGLLMAAPETVAQHVINAIRSGRRKTYAPPIWWLIMNLIKVLPNAILKTTGI